MCVFKLIKVHLLVSELYIGTPQFVITRATNLNKKSCYIFAYAPFC